MQCEIQWIDCSGKPTAHDASAIAYVALTEDPSKRFAICAEHLETLKAGRSHHAPDCPHLGGFAARDLWRVTPLVDPDLYARYRFFHEHAGWATPPGKAAYALALAKAEREAERRGLTVVWEDEMLPWDGDCEAPPIHVMASIYHPDRPEDCQRGHPHYYVLAHLGGIGLNSMRGIGLNSMRDPHVRVVEAELFQEALGVLDDEDEDAAQVLAERATFAAGDFLMNVAPGGAST